MFSLNFMFFCSSIDELCTKEENYKTSCNFNFGHECNCLKHSEIPCISEYATFLLRNIKKFHSYESNVYFYLM